MKNKRRLIHLLCLKIMIIGSCYVIFRGNRLFSQRIVTYPWIDTAASAESIQRALKDAPKPVPGINAYSLDGRTGLMLQTRLGRYDDVKLLLQYDADVRIISNDIEKTTALHIAAISLDWDKGLDIAMAILERGSLVNAQDAFGDTPLHKLLESYNTEKKHAFTDALITKYHADINIQDKNGNTPLHAGIYHNDIDWLTYVLQYYSNKINFSLKNNLGFTVKDLSRMFGYFTVSDLIDKDEQAQK